MEGKELSREKYFGVIYDNANKSLIECVAMANKKPRHMSRIWASIETDYETIGIVEMCNYNNLLEGRKSFYKATLTRENFYEQIHKKEYEIEPYRLSAIYFEKLYDAILSGSKERAMHMASLYGSIEVDVQVHPANIMLGYGLKYVILDDKEKALEYVQKLEESKTKRGMKQYADGNARVFRGLVERNEVEFNKGLEYMLKHHAARMKRDGRYLEQYFAYDSVALAMLAKERGIAITVKHELLPMEYLEDTDINYSELVLY